MTKKQLELLNFIYHKPKTVREIYDNLGLDYRSFLALMEGGPIDSCLDFDKIVPYENSKLIITNRGRSFVENSQKEFWNEVRYWITTIVAVAAFIKSFYF